LGRTIEAQVPLEVGWPVGLTSKEDG